MIFGLHITSKNVADNMNCELALGWPLWKIYVTNDHGYDPPVVNTSRSFPHSWFITGFATRLIRRVPLVEQELLYFPEHLSSPPVF